MLQLMMSHAHWNEVVVALAYDWTGSVLVVIVGPAAVNKEKDKYEMLVK